MWFFRPLAPARASVKDGNGNGNGNWKLEMVVKHGNDRQLNGSCLHSLVYRRIYEMAKLPVLDVAVDLGLAKIHV